MLLGVGDPGPESSTCAIHEVVCCLVSVVWYPLSGIRCLVSVVCCKSFWYPSGKLSFRSYSKVVAVEEEVVL